MTPAFLLSCVLLSLPEVSSFLHLPFPVATRGCTPCLSRRWSLRMQRSEQEDVAGLGGGEGISPAGASKKTNNRLFGSRRLELVRKALRGFNSSDESDVKVLLGSRRLARISKIVFGKEEEGFLSSSLLVSQPHVTESPLINTTMNMTLAGTRGGAAMLDAAGGQGAIVGERGEGAGAWRVIEKQWFDAILRALEEEEKELEARGTEGSEAGTQKSQLPLAVLSTDDFKLLQARAKEHRSLDGVSEYDLLRFFLLRKDPTTALQSILKHLEWLESSAYGMQRVADITSSSDGVGRQIAMKKSYILSKADVEQRPVVVVQVSRHDPDVSPVDETTRFVIHVLMEAEGLLRDPYPSHFSVIFDMSGASLKNVDYELVKRFIFILTNFYPERLGVMLIHQAPTFFPTFCWPLIKPWLNAATRDKVHFTRFAAEKEEEKLSYW
ncbi:hypothetical protein GUITHDRAFT_139150 [Guillardia theta CCMP2712]|uniref:CRAL-TRIO domain-containing protein n=1 Tax=Guillardia theta (strain CCMP2712) TaxID=905079 RepID=L1J9K0_GUITC|nr:hypothetical protein GUITHDRAFT_139150 [Guillardia theta CCMP2712]EKX45233.1 hypothetical protein GUITHDRAFT_139150 [Guillardia theta CCMP2712]|eukprot:XP_005832213.1 hypothetical protein GUITHDRAFT_139150 [Guillardia theta CCMP2712]